MFKEYFFEMMALLCTACVTSMAQGDGKLTPFADGFSSPVTITHAGDSRLFVVNQPGSIYVADSSGMVNPEPFLDITDRVTFGGEQGLLGLAFHPDYKNNGYFYVNYTGTGDSTHISRFTRLEGNRDKADPKSEKNILTIPQPYKNHNGGNLEFGPDGYLYIGMGDGGSGGDPERRAQNPAELLGKILRIDVSHGDPYSIPESNPFYGSYSVRNEIWILGLRNPWRFSFDRNTGDLWIADVGQNQVEEIDLQPAGSPGGENYGWRCYEGNHLFDTAGCVSADLFVFPVYTYPHGLECSVTGGFVFRGDSSSPYYGKYFFADYCSDMIWTLHHDNTGWVREDFGHFPGSGFSTFGEDVKGELYVASHLNGIIYRISNPLTGFRHETELKGIRCFNDPLSGKIYLEINGSARPDADLVIYDMQGAARFRDRIKSEKYEFSTSWLNNGIYLISLRMEGKTWSQKVAVER
jgi:glucose/arabinose dehydrogenase